MKSLLTYLECDFATPANTLGAGNPSVDPDGNGLSEPIGVIKGCSGKNYAKKQKKKNMKDLKEFLQESLVCESKQIPVTAYKLDDLVNFAAKFNPSDKDADWDTWEDDYNISDKATIKQLCKICSTIVKKCDYGSTFLGNFPYDDGYAQQEILQQEFDAKPDDVYYLLTADGDDGRFFYIKRPRSSSDQKAVDELTTMVIGRGNWDWIEIAAD